MDEYVTDDGTFVLRQIGEEPTVVAAEYVEGIGITIGGPYERMSNPNDPPGE